MCSAREKQQAFSDTIPQNFVSFNSIRLYQKYVSNKKGNELCFFYFVIFFVRKEENRTLIPGLSYVCGWAVFIIFLASVPLGAFVLNYHVSPDFRLMQKDGEKKESVESWH